MWIASSGLYPPSEADPGAITKGVQDTFHRFLLKTHSNI